MIIEVILTDEIFRRFTMFDVFRRRKLWRNPVLFALILAVSAGICFSMRRVSGAVLLGSVLLAVGLGVPALLAVNFFLSLNKQITQLGLKRGKHVYTLELTDRKDGIHVYNEKEEARYPWKKIHHAYRDTLATYLFITPQRSFILPHTCMEGGDAAGVWTLITGQLPPEKCTVL